MCIRDSTQGIPQPKTGTVVNGWIDSDKQYCYLEFSDMDSQEYMEDLKEAGFTEIEKVSEKIKGQNALSVGAVLSDGKTALSTSYFENHFGLYIHLEE